tara:strand:- start:1051 stop:1602 length:552 start_codon:yes stop_codon:yes gene_type:complete
VFKVKEKQALTTGEVAKYCGVNFRTVIRWIERGHLDAYKLPGRGDNRIPVESFVDFLTSNNMPVPDELNEASHKMVMLASNESMAADIAACVRRAGWDLLVTQDSVYFGYLISQHHPAAVVVTQAGVQDSVQKILRDCDLKETLCIAVTAEDIPDALAQGWMHMRWPHDQQQFMLQLTSNEAA